MFATRHRLPVLPFLASRLKSLRQLTTVRIHAEVMYLAANCRLLASRREGGRWSMTGQEAPPAEATETAAATPKSCSALHKLAHRA